MSTSCFETGNFKDDLLQMLFLHQLDNSCLILSAKIHIFFDTECLFRIKFLNNKEISRLFLPPRVLIYFI